MTVRTRKGFTLVELIVVIAIFGIVSMAIMTVFQFTTRSFSNANLRSKQQYETRMAMDQVKKEIGIARNVVISDVIPATLPATRGYCYYDLANHYLRLRTAGGISYTLISNLPASMPATVQFTPVAINSIYNTVHLNWTIGDYNLATDVFISNMTVYLGNVTTTYDISGTPPPGVYIEFD